MEKKDVFVKTKDLETADTLKKDGFIQVDYSAGVWTFLQCKEKYEDTKSKINETKISFSNTLNI